MSQVTSKNGDRSDIRRIPTKDIRLDHAYQRDAKTERVETLVSHWNPQLAGLIILSHRADALWCVDGQHRLAAMLELGIDMADCTILEGLSQMDEANLFVLYNSSSQHLSGWDKFKAQLVARDPAAVEVQGTVLATGFKLTPMPGNFDNIQALAGVRRIHAVGGVDLLKVTLNTVRAIWRGDRHATGAMMLGGLGAFIWAYQTEPQFQFDRLTDIMEVIPPVRFLRRAAEIRYERVSQKATAFSVAEALREQYNSGLSKDNQLGVLTHRNVSRTKSGMPASPRPKAMKPGSRRSQRLAKADVAGV